jgi:hypothetical protein
MLSIVVRKALAPLARLISSTIIKPRPYATQVLGAAAPSYVQPPPRNVSSLPTEFRDAFSETVEGKEKVLYKLENAGVSWHGIVQRGLTVFVPSLPYTEAEAEFSAVYGLRQWVGNAVVKFEGTVGLVYDYWSVNNYYHWLIDALPRLLILRDVAPGCALLMPTPLPEYMTATARALGFSVFCLVPKLAFTRGVKLLMPSHTATVGRQDQKLIRAVRGELIQALCTSTSNKVTRKIYASRSRQKNRRLLNEEQILPLLLEQGFELVYFEEMTLTQQIDLMQQTAVFMGVHGANMTNILFLPEEATVIELMSTKGVNLCYFNLTSNLGMAYHVVPCVAVEGSASLANNADVTVELTDVERVVLQAAVK